MVRTSTPAPMSWVAVKWRRSWRRTVGAPIAFRTRMKKDVTLSGRKGVLASTKGEKTNALAECRASLSCPLDDVSTVLGEESDTNWIEGNRARAIGLRRLLRKPAGHDDERTGHLDNSQLQVNVVPSERAQLTPPHPGERSEHEEWCETRISLFRRLDHLPHHVIEGAGDAAGRDSRRLRLLGDVMADPAPADALVERRRNDGVVVTDGSW